MKKVDEQTRVKKPYEPMKVTFLGKVNTVVQKSGNYPDNSMNYDSKTFDAGRGNG